MTLTNELKKYPNLIRYFGRISIQGRFAGWYEFGVVVKDNKQEKEIILFRSR